MCVSPVITQQSVQGVPYPSPSACRDRLQTRDPAQVLKIHRWMILYVCEWVCMYSCMACEEERERKKHGKAEYGNKAVHQQTSFVSTLTRRVETAALFF